MATKLVITVEYILDIADDKAAGLMRELAEKHGTDFGSENWNVWEFNPEEKVISSEFRSK